MVRIRDIFLKKKTKKKEVKKQPVKQVKKSKKPFFKKLFSHKKKPIKKEVKKEPKKPKKKIAIKPFFKKKGVISLLIILLLLGFLFYFGVTPFNTCKTESCFDDALKTCSSLKYEKYHNSNLYIYRIYRSFGSKCRIRVTLDKMAIGSDRDLIELLEEKSMLCTIPKTDTEAIKKLNYCHGELKEGLQQVLLQRVYGLLIKDIPEILETANI